MNQQPKIRIGLSVLNQINRNQNKERLLNAIEIHVKDIVEGQVPLSFECVYRSVYNYCVYFMDKVKTYNVNAKALCDILDRYKNQVTPKNFMALRDTFLYARSRETEWLSYTVVEAQVKRLPESEKPKNLVCEKFAELKRYCMFTFLLKNTNTEFPKLTKNCCKIVVNQMDRYNLWPKELR